MGTTQFRLLGITFNVDLSKIIEVKYNDKIIQTRSASRWHAIANPQASGRNCPCTTQHSFKHPGKILLVCYSTHHSLQFDMPHDHVVRNLIFDPAPPPVPPQRVFLGSQSKSRSLCFTSITTEYMCTFSHKNL